MLVRGWTVQLAPPSSLRPSAGGLLTNVEANVAVKLDLTNEEHMQGYRIVQNCFSTYWSEVE